MKVILNRDVANLGEEGDIKDVAKGYARNFLFPRNIALPCTDRVIKLFEARKSEIEARKEEKRQAALGLKERLEGLELKLVMPAGPNGKLYGAVTNLTLMEELGRQGFEVERKRIEVPGNNIKNTGRYKVHVKLYGSAGAELNVVVAAAEVKEEVKSEPSAANDAKARRGRRRAEERSEGGASEEGAAVAGGAGEAAAGASDGGAADGGAGAAAGESAASDSGATA